MTLPHIIIEHSPNAFTQKENPSLLQAVYQCVAKTELFKIDNLKIRLHPCADFRLADEYAEYIHVQGRIHKGRSTEDKKMLSSELLKTLAEFAQKQTVLTCEVVDMQTDSYSKLEKL